MSNYVICEQNLHLALYKMKKCETIFGILQNNNTIINIGQTWLNYCEPRRETDHNQGIKSIESNDPIITRIRKRKKIQIKQ